MPGRSGPIGDERGVATVWAAWWLLALGSFSAVCSVALALWPAERRVRVCVGSAGPTPITPGAAEGLASDELDWDGGSAPGEPLLDRVAEAVAAAASPIDDVRGTAAYRRRAVAVLARRTLGWAWSEHATGVPA